MELLAPLPAGVLRGPWPGGTLHVRGNADTPGGGTLGLLGAWWWCCPSKEFWFVGWLPRSKAKCRVCRKQPGGTACLVSEWKTRSDEQELALEGSL